MPPPLWSILSPFLLHPLAPCPVPSLRTGRTHWCLCRLSWTPIPKDTSPPPPPSMVEWGGLASSGNSRPHVGSIIITIGLLQITLAMERVADPFSAFEYSRIICYLSVTVADAMSGSPFDCHCHAGMKCMHMITSAQSLASFVVSALHGFHAAYVRSVVITASMDCASA